MTIMLFPEFETLDVFGPVEVLGHCAAYSLDYYSMEGGIVISSQGVAVMTKPIAQAERSGVLFIPGGQGTRPLVTDARFLALVNELATEASYTLTVCTGSAVLAVAHFLDGRKATSNKRAFQWVSNVSHAVLWQPKARWVKDGNCYTSSGVSAGIDMALGFIADQQGRSEAESIAAAIEYVWQSDAEIDPFAFAGDQ
ncbi:MAG: DJ-1/PfpI family protein [Sporolactobacillus sp.]